MFVTFGLLLLTALYVGMVVAIQYASPVECFTLETNDLGLCQSEAVDNSILNWASDAFVAVTSFALALHLSVCVDPTAREIFRSAILAQVFGGGAFVMQGLGHSLYPNSGLDDNRGMLAHWIARILSNIFFVVSAVATAHFALDASSNTNPVLLGRSILAKSWLVSCCEVVLVLSLAGFLTGSIWCSTEADLRTDEIILDGAMEQIENEDLFEDQSLHVCFSIAHWSEVAINASYALLWLPVGALLGAASKQRPVLVMGLPTPIAAVIATVAQWTAGSLFLVAFAVVDAFVATRQDYFEAWNLVYGTVFYHWAMLVTACCLHNLSYGLPARYYENDGNENDDDDEQRSVGPAPLSWEWWVTMAAGVVPEPKTKEEREQRRERKREKERQRHGQQQQQQKQQQKEQLPRDEENDPGRTQPPSTQKSVTFDVDELSM